ncbi:MAG: hypothetical protein AMXMBFR84_45650 [Candidatus Hydrogenedentota bacterium]
MKPHSFPALFLLIPVCFAFFATAEETPAPTRHVYMHLPNPREYPDDARRPVHPPTWDDFGGVTQFATMRGFPMADGKLVNISEELEKYTVTHNLGTVIWPHYPFLWATNLDELMAEMKRRNLFLFDVWGYVPGSGKTGDWIEYDPPAEALALFERELGPKWLGMDIGEQDGRYIGGYANQMFPISPGRRDQYLNFYRHFEHMGDALGNRLSTLISLNYGHYLIKDGTYTTIGAETAQGLPSGQVYYSFIRGAGKQYGVPWFGNASVFNRWGWKTYGATGEQNGPTKGTSLSLLKRLMYNHILYNCVFAGFESSWFDGEALSPIGRIQQSAVEWVKTHGSPGIMQTPVAILQDFYSGWTFPRHLYSDHTWRVWGNLPYDDGDFLADNILAMAYPTYRDASYFRDETGFISPTPYGDIVDCLLTDVEGWVLQQYPVVIVAGHLEGSEELRHKLNRYAQDGGHLVLTSENLANAGMTVTGVTIGEPIQMQPNLEVNLLGESMVEATPWIRRSLQIVDGVRVLAHVGGIPIAVQTNLGNGQVTVLASEYGLPVADVNQAPMKSEENVAFETPRPLLKHVRLVLDQVLRDAALFTANDGLSVITCRKEAGVYTIGITNALWTAAEMKLTSHVGPIESIEELKIDTSERGAVGHLPENMEKTDIGINSDSMIAGGDVRIFRVRVAETGVMEIPKQTPPARAQQRLLPLRAPTSIEEAILLRPTFFQMYDGVVVDWRYLNRTDEDTLRDEGQWLALRNVVVYVDLTSGLNLYPNLRLLENDAERFAESMDTIKDVLAKMTLLGSNNMIVSLHRHPENNFTREQAESSFRKVLADVCALAHAHSITLHLRQGLKQPYSLQEAARLLDELKAPNLKLAIVTGGTLTSNLDPTALTNLFEGKIGLWLLGASTYDHNNAITSMSGPLNSDVLPDLKQLLALAPNVPIAFDMVLHNTDEEYEQGQLLDRILGE